MNPPWRAKGKHFTFRIRCLFLCYGCGCLYCVTVVLFCHVCVRVCTYLSENSPFADWSGGEAVTGAALGPAKQRGYSAGRNCSTSPNSALARCCVRSVASPSQKAAERLKPLWSSPDEWNDDNGHLPYMSEATPERACNKPARTPKPVRILQSVAHGLPTVTVNTSPLERPGRGLHGSSDFGPHKE